MAAFDRDALLAALSDIGSDDDAIAAKAGRSATTLLAEAGLAWPDVVSVPPEPAEIPPEEPSDNDVSDTGESAATAQNADDALVLIDKLLARDSLYEGTRDDLLAYKDDIASGEFNDDDLAYLNALYARVALSGVRKKD